MNRLLFVLFYAAATFSVFAAAIPASTSTRVIYASQVGAKLNSSVWNGGGTDDSAALQYGLDLSTNYGGYEFVVDGPALISTNLVVRSNTKLRFLSGAGLFMKDHANCWTVGNQQNTNYSTTNIIIEGGIINCNGNAQAEYITNGFRLNGAPGVHGMWFAGVDNLRIRDVMLISAKCYSFLINDSRNIIMEDCATYYTNNVAGTNSLYGNDGIHLYGNLANFRANGFWAHGNQDDIVAMMTDETDFTLPFNDPRWTTNSGTMTNMVFENFFFDGCKNLGKIQDYTSGSTVRAADVTLRNFHGSVSHQGFLVFDTIGTGIPAENFVIDNMNITVSGNLDPLGYPILKLDGLVATKMSIEQVRLMDTAGAGIGTVGLISVASTCTNISLSDIMCQGSAGSVSSGDSAISILTGTPIGANVSIANLTAKSLSSAVQTDQASTAGGGVVRFSNLQLGTGVTPLGAPFTNVSGLVLGNGQMIGDGSGITNANGWVTMKVSGSDATTTGQSLVDVTGLTYPLAANSTYLFKATLLCTTTAVTSGTEYGVANTGATANVGMTTSFFATGFTNAAGVGPGAVYTVGATNTATSPFLLGSGQTGVVTMEGFVTTLGGPPTLAIRHLKVTSGTSTVKVGSTLEVLKVN